MPVGTDGNDTFLAKAFGKGGISDPSSTDQDLVKAPFDFTLGTNLENLQLINNAPMLTLDFGGGDVNSLARLGADPTNAIVGSWSIDTGAAMTVITFLADGTYLLAQDGVEKGTYTWNAEGGFTRAISVDTNGDEGLSNATISAVHVDGNTMTMSITGEGDYVFSRVVSESPIVGSWYSFGALADGGVAVVTFLANGEYMMGQAANTVGAGHSGNERGTYEWNSASGAMTVNVAQDTNGDWGFVNGTADPATLTVTTRSTNGTGNAGANTITGDGGANQLSGLGGNDILKGNGGADKLLGGAGADQLYGGAGKDILNGGAGGADKFYFDVAATGANADTIQNFERGLDKIVLDDDIFQSFAGKTTVGVGKLVFGTAAVDGDDYLIYDQAHGKLYYDADGSGTGVAKVLVATLNAGTVLDAADFKIVA